MSTTSIYTDLINEIQATIIQFATEYITRAAINGNTLELPKVQFTINPLHSPYSVSGERVFIVGEHTESELKELVCDYQLIEGNELTTLHYLGNDHITRNIAELLVDKLIDSDVYFGDLNGIPTLFAHDVGDEYGLSLQLVSLSHTDFTLLLKAIDGYVEERKHQFDAFLNATITNQPNFSIDRNERMCTRLLNALCCSNSPFGSIESGLIRSTLSQHNGVLRISGVYNPQELEMDLPLEISIVKQPKVSFSKIPYALREFGAVLRALREPTLETVLAGDSHNEVYVSNDKYITEGDSTTCVLYVSYGGDTSEYCLELRVVTHRRVKLSVPESTGE